MCKTQREYDTARGCNMGNIGVVAAFDEDCAAKLSGLSKQQLSYWWTPRKTSGLAKRAKIFPMKSKGNFSDSIKQGSFSRCPGVEARAITPVCHDTMKRQHEILHPHLNRTWSSSCGGWPPFLACRSNDDAGRTSCGAASSDGRIARCAASQIKYLPLEGGGAPQA